MKIFLSYASEDRPQAEEIQLALAGAGHEVFFDRESLPASGDYHARIKASVDEAELFVFLISPDSVAPGGYALTEMGYARSRWPHPKGHVLPVLLRPTPFATMPAYLKSVTVLEPRGNAAAEVVAATARLAAPGSRLRKLALAGGAGVLLLAIGAYVALKPPVATARRRRPGAGAEAARPRAAQPGAAALQLQARGPRPRWRSTTRCASTCRPSAASSMANGWRSSPAASTATTPRTRPRTNASWAR